VFSKSASRSPVATSGYLARLSAKALLSALFSRRRPAELHSAGPILAGPRLPRTESRRRRLFRCRLPDMNTPSRSRCRTADRTRDPDVDLAQGTGPGQTVVELSKIAAAGSGMPIRTGLGLPSTRGSSDASLAKVRAGSAPGTSPGCEYTTTSPRRSRYFGHKTILHNDLCEIVKIQTIFPPRRALQLIARSLNLPMSSDFHRSVPTRPPRSTAEASDGAIPANSSPTSLLFIAAAAVSPVDRPRAALAGERPRRPPWANPGA
jgi:hypothetical protein